MNIQTLLADKHTTFSGVAFCVIEGGSQIAQMWWPQYKEKIDSTARILGGLAVLYMGASAAGSSQISKQVQDAKADVKAAIDSGHTEMLVSKPEVKPTNPT